MSVEWRGNGAVW